MRAALLLILASTAIATADTKPPAAPSPEVTVAAAWVKESLTSIDAAVARMGTSFRHAAKAIGGAGCLNKHKLGLIVVKQRKAYVTCVGKVFDEISPNDTWETFAAADIPEDYRPFAKQFPKTSRFVRSSYSDGFIFVVLGVGKDGGEPPVIGLWIDRSQAG